MLPIDLRLALHTFGVSAILLLLIIIEVYAPEGPKEYIPKKQRPPKSLWIKAFYTAFNRFTDGLDKMIMNIKVRPPTTKTKDLWQTYKAEETASSIPYPRSPT